MHGERSPHAREWDQRHLLVHGLVPLVRQVELLLAVELAAMGNGQLVSLGHGLVHVIVAAAGM